MNSDVASAGPLAGIKVLDLTAVVLGPLATVTLGDYGADVIKVEGPDGDMMRKNGISLHPGMSSIFLALNRNKRSLGLDLQTEQGKTVLNRIIPHIDVFVHNMRVDAIERLGFGYTAVAARNPNVVYCVATGFDQDGPDKARPAFDDIIQAASGLATLAGHGRSSPDYVPTLIADKTAGMAVVNAVLAALFHRERTGCGQYVEVPMFETLAGFVLAEHLGGITFEGNSNPAGYARLLGGGRRPVKASDGYLSILPYSPKHWKSFFDATGHPEFLSCLEIQEETKRVPALYSSLAEIVQNEPTDYWMALCDRLDIPSTKIYSLDDLPSHPQLQAVGFFPAMDHPTEGRIRYTRPAVKFQQSPAAVRLPAPKLGQHNAELLGEYGFSPDEIGDLQKAKVLVA